MTRDEIQRKGVEDWFVSGGRGTLLFGVGTGKSKAALDIRDKLSPFRTLIVYDRLTVKENWLEEFEKFGKSTEGVVFTTYISLPKQDIRNYDLVVLDECDCITRRSFQFFKQGFKAKVLGLTGTWPENDDKIAMLNAVAPVCCEWSLQDSVEHDIVADYRIYLKGVDLNLDELEKVKSFEKRISFYRKKGWNAQKIIFERSRFLASTSEKLKVARKISEYLVSQNEKHLVFAGTIEAAEKVCDNTYHSKNKHEDGLNRLNEGEISALSVVNSVDRGVSIDGIKNTIFTRYNATGGMFNQRLGRGVRRKDGKPTLVFCVYNRNSKDEIKWLNACLASYDRKKILKM